MSSRCSAPHARLLPPLCLSATTNAAINGASAARTSPGHFRSQRTRAPARSRPRIRLSVGARRAPRQRRVGEVLVPGSEHARGQSAVLRVNRHRRPVDVTDDCTSARSKGPVQFGNSRIHVRDVLEYLHADRAVECPALDRERIAPPSSARRSRDGAAGASKLKHWGAVVYAHDGAGRTNDLRELKTVEAWSHASNIEDSVSEDCPECLANQFAATRSIVDLVEDLDPAGEVGVEFQLAHLPT